jgi:glutathione S-transferase
MDWQQSTVMPGLGPVFVGLVRTPAERRNMPAIGKGVDAVKAALHILDRHLADRAYILGDLFTIADIPLGCAVYRWYALPVEHGDMPNLRAWHERLANRAGFAEQVMLPLT